MVGTQNKGRMHAPSRGIQNKLFFKCCASLSKSSIGPIQSAIYNPDFKPIKQIILG